MSVTKEWRVIPQDSRSIQCEKRAWPQRGETMIVKTIPVYNNTQHYEFSACNNFGQSHIFSLPNTLVYAQIPVQAQLYFVFIAN